MRLHKDYAVMDYDELVAKVIELLQREKRVPYRALKRRFDLDDDYIEDLKIDLIEAKRLASDENDRILVWLGAGWKGNGNRSLYCSVTWRTRPRLPMILDTGTQRRERNVRQQHCMAKPNPPSNRWRRPLRMRCYAPPSSNQRWYKKFTNGLHGWAVNKP
jgi:hypothetical protein